MLTYAFLNLIEKTNIILIVKHYLLTFFKETKLERVLLKKIEKTEKMFVCLYRDFCHCGGHYYSKDSTSCRKFDLNLWKDVCFFKHMNFKILKIVKNNI